jgi:hypothetical protein
MPIKLSSSHAGLRQRYGLAAILWGKRLAWDALSRIEAAATFPQLSSRPRKGRFVRFARGRGRVAILAPAPQLVRGRGRRVLAEGLGKTQAQRADPKRGRATGGLTRFDTAELAAGQRESEKLHAGSVRPFSLSPLPSVVFGVEKKRGPCGPRFGGSLFAKRGSRQARRRRRQATKPMASRPKRAA